MISRLFAGNFRRPTGLLGRFVGNIMARGNEHEQGWTLALLDIQPSDHILEIGFGPGVAIQQAAQHVVNGQVVGIDYSETMVQVARKRNVTAIKTGRVALKRGEVTSLPYPDASFDKAFTIHCIYFWEDPIHALRQLRRVLKPGGLLAVTIMPRDAWPKQRPVPPDLFTLYSGSEVEQMLATAGFHNVRMEQCPQTDMFPGVCVLGTS